MDSSAFNSSNIADCLPHLAKSRPFDRAVIFPEGRSSNGKVRYSHYTYSQLQEKSDSFAWGLKEAGIVRGTRVVLMVRPSLEFYSLSFALFKLGAVPVLIDPGMGVKPLKKCIAESNPSAFIGIRKAHLARLLLGWGKKSLKILIHSEEKALFGGLTLKELERKGASKGEFPAEKMAPSDMAAILFTSGSTGLPKGVVYSHKNFSAQVYILQRLYGIKEGEVDLPTFPLFGLFGPALGMAVVIPDMNFTRPAKVQPEKILEAIDDFGVTNMFGSPALLNRLARYGVEHKIKIKSLKRVISAGAPVPAKVIEKMRTILPEKGCLHTPYGATEALPVCSIESREILEETTSRTIEGAGVCVGLPLSSVKVGIIKIDDEVIEKWSDDLLLPPGEVGEIVVKGPVVTEEYFGRPQSTKLSKIPHPHRKEFYHRMGDLGYFDRKGRLWFCGRKAHRVVTKNEELYTIPCEGVFNNHPAVFRTALVGVKRKGEILPVLCVELEKEGAQGSRQKIEKELLELGASKPHTKNIKSLLFHPAFPVDIRHNAKIFREKLALWAEKKLP